MSAAADSSAPTAANPASGENNARLEQPNDAVAMESMHQSPQEASSKDLDAPAAATASGAADGNEGSKPVAATSESVAAAQTEQAGTSSSPAADSQAKDEEDAPQPPLKERQESVMAIGPAQDEIKAVTQGAEDTGPVCNITLLLTSGSRHPYKISARYLSRRNVPIPEETENGQPDPFSISVYTLKELILREWRSDWEAKPASPSSIRLIHFGKLLDDKEPLKKYQLIPESPNVVHMSIRPPDLDEEEPKSGAKNASHGADDEERPRSGGCCVVL